MSSSINPYINCEIMGANCVCIFREVIMASAPMLSTILKATLREL